MKIKICLLSIIFFSLISTQVVAETTLNATQKYKFLSEQYLSQAKKAYNKNDYDNALMLFQKSAALNNAIADFLLGTLYYAPKPGTPITRNYDLAIAHMTRSAQLGNIDAKKWLISFQLKGFGKTTPEKILQLRSELEANLSNTNKINNLINLVDSYMSVQRKELRNINKAESLTNQLLTLKLEQDQKNIVATYCMAISVDYIFGMEGTKKDPKQAFEWMKRATDLDLKEAYYNLSDMYFYGYGTEVNFKKSIAMIKRGDQLKETPYNYNHQKHIFSLPERFFIYLIQPRFLG